MKSKAAAIALGLAVFIVGCLPGAGEQPASQPTRITLPPATNTAASPTVAPDPTKLPPEATTLPRATDTPQQPPTLPATTAAPLGDIVNGLPIPDTVCTLYNPGDLPIPIFSGTSSAHAVIARLVDWIPAVGAEDGWFIVTLSDGNQGVIRDGDVLIKTPCGFSPTGIPIHFAPGEIRAVHSGILLAGEIHDYSFIASEGQLMVLELLSADPEVFFALTFPDGSVIPVLDRGFRLPLPTSGKHYLTLSGATGETAYSFVIQIDPPGAGQPPVVGQDGVPPDDRCAVTHPGGTMVVPIRNEPSLYGEVVGYLSSWLPVSSGVDGWYRIDLQGNPAWISMGVGQSNGHCPLD